MNRQSGNEAGEFVPMEVAARLEAQLAAAEAEAQSWRSKMSSWRMRAEVAEKHLAAEREGADKAELARAELDVKYQTADEERMRAEATAKNLTTVVDQLRRCLQAMTERAEEAESKLVAARKPCVYLRGRVYWASFIDSRGRWCHRPTGKAKLSDARRILAGLLEHHTKGTNS